MKIDFNMHGRLKMEVHELCVNNENALQIYVDALDI